jgi:AAA15 family ATPase/GTPase
MLIEFSVENFMCFKNEVTFSFEAMEDLAEDKFYNPESRRDIGIDGIGLINTVNGIYGKNASGKSTLFTAIKRLFNLLKYSAKFNDDDDFSVSYNDDSKPIVFKTRFSDEALNVYSYSLHIQGEKGDAKVVYEELKNEVNKEFIFERKENIITHTDVLTPVELDFFKNNLQKNQLIFAYTFSRLKEIRACFGDKVNDSMGVRSRPFLRNRKHRVLDFIESYMIPAIAGMPDKVQEKLQLPNIKALILNELKVADFNIEDYFFEEDKLVFVHKNKVKRHFGEESDGTKKYFCLLLDVTLNILDTGGLYIVDELEKALHPLLARRFINLFKNPETNPKNARLLFSSHDIMFLHHNALNGDQIWFIDRDDETNETKLYSPAEYEDFDPLKLQSEYLLGAYDAVPNTEWRT